ncbi:MAG: hypothetical protein E3J72_19305 [Planctomycetota bacterium]|nr:MAG: hypothetical protein E3J72_19305 [Planctomycetota bacterium]
MVFSLKICVTLVPVLLSVVLLTSCTDGSGKLVVFHAPCYSPVMDAIRAEQEKSLGVKLVSEVSGSQVACRKVTELGRECDLLIVADSGLLRNIASSRCSWRLDFAHDSVVLGVGTRAKKVDDAEKDWVPVLLDEKIRLGRVDENLGPIGYRTLLVWALKEKKGHPGLGEKLRKKSVKTVEHVSQLAALLKAGDVGYGFLYRTTCLKNDIRFIELQKEINLGSPGVDYSGTEVSFTGLKAGKKETIKIKGSRITYGLTIPDNAPGREKAIEFVRYILSDRKDVFTSKGFIFFKPKFYGPRDSFKPFDSFADYAGEF